MVVVGMVRNGKGGSLGFIFIGKGGGTEVTRCWWRCGSPMGVT